MDLLKAVMKVMEEATTEIEGRLSEEPIETTERDFVRAGYDAMNAMFGGFGTSEKILVNNQWIIEMLQSYNVLLLKELTKADDADETEEGEE